MLFWQKETSFSFSFWHVFRTNTSTLVCLHVCFNSFEPDHDHTWRGINCLTFPFFSTVYYLSVGILAEEAIVLLSPSFQLFIIGGTISHNHARRSSLFFLICIFVDVFLFELLFILFYTFFILSCELNIMNSWISYIQNLQFVILAKRGSRHATHAAKALGWRLDQLLKCLIKKITLSS